MQPAPRRRRMRKTRGTVEKLENPARAEKWGRRHSGVKWAASRMLRRVRNARMSACHAVIPRLILSRGQTRSEGGAAIFRLQHRSLQAISSWMQAGINRATIRA